MVNTLKSAALCLAVLSFCCVTLLAQDVQSHRPQSVHVSPSTHHVAAPQQPAGLTTIYSNLGPASNAYYDADGWLVLGARSDFGESQWIAQPFTPKADSTVDRVLTAVGYRSGATNAFTLSIYNDAGGFVGTVLTSTTIKNAPTFGTCCTLNTWNLKTPLAVTGGTQYWIVATSPNGGSGSDFDGAWAFSNLEFFDTDVADGGWFDSRGSAGFPAAAVLGTIP